MATTSRIPGGQVHRIRTDDKKIQLDRVRIDRLWEASMDALRLVRRTDSDSKVAGVVRTQLEAVAKEYFVKIPESQNIGERYIKRPAVGADAPADRHLGDALKWLAVLHVVLHERTASDIRTPGDDAQSCIDRLRVYAPDWPSMQPFRILLWVTSTTGPQNFSTTGSEAFEVLLEWLNDLTSRKGRRPLMARELLDHPTPWGDDAAGALQAFRDWLVTDVWTPVSSMPSSSAPTLPDRMLATALQAAELLLEPGTTAPVVNALCGEARELADPFADAVVREISNLDERRLASRGDEAAPPRWSEATTVIRISIGTSAPPPRGEDAHMFTTTDALARIACAFGMDVDAQELSEYEHLYRRTMNEVRRACTLRRCVIVFCMLEYFEGRHSRLLNLMKGRGWGAFVRVLSQVHWQTAVQFGLEKPAGARVLVVSDAKMVTLGRWAGDAIEIAASHADASGRPTEAPSWQSLHAAVCASPRADPQDRAKALVQLVLLAFVACSPDGASYGTLLRGLRHWLDLTGRIRRPDRPDQLVEAPGKDVRAEFERAATGGRIVAAVDELLSTYGADIARSVDEPLPWVNEGRMRFEWQARADELDLPSSEGDGVQRLFESKVHFVSEARRRLFIRGVLTGSEAPPAGWPMGVVLGDHLWQLVNFSIAIEALRQATSQLRSLRGREAHKLETTRRLVQTIYHLRAAGDIDITDQDGDYAAYLTIPKSPAKRFRYTYCFLLRRCVEADGDFRLTRTHARPEIRTPLISLFLVDDVRSLETGRSDDARQFVAALEEGHRRWQPQSSLRGAELLPDILVNLATSAIDADDFAVAEWALGKIWQGGEELRKTREALTWSGNEIDERRVLQSWASGYGASYAKLQFDYLDKTGERRAAHAHCLEWLSKLGPGEQLPEEIVGVVRTYM
jgi:hypothetical protein